MRATRLTLLLAALAVALSVLLYVKSRVRGDEDLKATIDGARHLRELDARIDRAVLEAKTGLVLDYDELTSTVRDLEAAQRAVEETTRNADPALAAHVTRTGARVRDKAVQVEHFKSANSLLRNSLSYVPRAARQASEVSAGAPLAEQARGSRGALVSVLASMEDCAVDCAPESVIQLRRDIASLESLHDGVPSPARENVSTVLRHAKLVATEGPLLGQAIRALLEAGSRPYDELYVEARERREAAIANANGYRVLLVAFSVALLGAIYAMVRRLRRKQAQLEELNQGLESRVEERTRELSRSREQYRSLVETTQAVPWETAPGEHRLAYVGPQASPLFGYPAEDFLRAGFLARVIHVENLAETQAWLASLSPDGALAERQVRCQTSDGRAIWLRVFGGAVHDSDGLLVRRGFFLDETKHHLLEAELRSAQKLESVGRLASGIAHEINTPVQYVSDSMHFVKESVSAIVAVLGALRRLLDAAPEEIPALMNEARRVSAEADTDYFVENVPDALVSAVEGLGRIAAIVAALKEFSHPDRTAKSAIDLNANLRSTLVIAANEYKYIAEIATDLGELPRVVCHGGQINQVLLNLIVNAAHAIETAVKGTTRRGLIKLRTWHEDGSVFVCVRDNGGGIPLDIQHRLFDPFFTTKDVGKGTGQGLAIARNIVVDKHCGALTFETDRDRGTAFVMRLPVAPSDAASVAA